MLYKGITIDPTRDLLFSPLGRDLTQKYYDKEQNGTQKAIARAAYAFSFGDKDLAQRIYDYASQHWMFYSSPIFSNAPEGEWVGDYWEEFNNLRADGHMEELCRTLAFSSTWKGEKSKSQPIACFLVYAEDSIASQIDAVSEVSQLSVAGGGTAVHLSGIRAVSDKAPGPIPFAKVFDGVVGYYRQGATRRGATALYLDISHPDIEEFIRMRTTSGGDPSRKIDNRVGIHHGLNITDAFRNAVMDGQEWSLYCPHTGRVTHTYPNARDLWDTILEIRELTGEPFLWFSDIVNESMPETQKALGLKNHGSNLCTEITLATGPERTAVCCLSSPNLEKYPEWRHTTLIQDLVVFLDNVLEWFIINAARTLPRAVASAQAERAIGIGAMGWAGFLQRMHIPFESGGLHSAAQYNWEIFSYIKDEAVKSSQMLATLRGEPEDMIGTGMRNSHLLAIAPNSNSADLCNTTPSCEPLTANVYTKVTRAGTVLIKNKYLEPFVEEAAKALLVSPASLWKEVLDDGGSVQNVGWLSDADKLVFKTVYEVDQHHVVEQYGDRQQFICQAQSMNLSFLPGSDRTYIASVHYKILADRKVKSAYYMRTGSEGVADTVKHIERRVFSKTASEEADCLSCQG